MIKDVLPQRQILRGENEVRMKIMLLKVFGDAQRLFMRGV